jgi:hypothetical protein
MDAGQLILMVERLVLGTAASIFAIINWSRSRDSAWLAIVFAVLANYLNVLYSMLKTFGVVTTVRIGSVPVLSIVLDALPLIFLIVTFVIVIMRKYK